MSEPPAADTESKRFLFGEVHFDTHTGEFTSDEKRLEEILRFLSESHREVVQFVAEARAEADIAEGKAKKSWRWHKMFVGVAMSYFVILIVKEILTW